MSTMDNISQLQLNQFIGLASVDQQYKKAIISAQKKYFIKHLSLEALSPHQVVGLISKGFSKESWVEGEEANASICGDETNWALNEFKIFCWVSVWYGFINKKQFQQFTEDDYEFLQKIFFKKSKVFLEYQMRSLLKSARRAKERWSEGETRIFQSVIMEEKNKGKLRWSQISLLLFIKSNKQFYRTSQKCREKWFNHLNPDVNHNKWSLQEDLQLFQHSILLGPKWASISKVFKGTRTQHMVKNRYKAILKKYQSKSPKANVTKTIDRIVEDLKKKLNLDHDHKYTEKSTEEIVQPYQMDLVSIRKAQTQENSILSSQISEMKEELQANNNLDLCFWVGLQMRDAGEIVREIELKQIDDLEPSSHLTSEDEYLNSLLL